MKYYSLIVFLILFSCGKQEDILLPKSDATFVQKVLDHSPIYLFFRTKGKDTLVEVNRKNSIISTNWILNIDKRLPLRLVIPEVMKLQEKKRKEVAHKNEAAENYYSYADSIGRNLAFFPFTQVYYTLAKPKKTEGEVIVQFIKGSNVVLVDGVTVYKGELLMYLYGVSRVNEPSLVFVFDKNMSYEEYIQTKVLFKRLDTYKIGELPKEYVF